MTARTGSVVVGMLALLLGGVLLGPAPARAAEPAPLPAGRLAFTRAQYDRGADGSSSLSVRGLGTIGLDGSSPRTLTDPPPPAFDHSPDWSPDGRYVAALSSPPSGSGDTVVVAAADASATSTVGVGTWPSWSPDGRLLAYASTDPAQPGVHLLPVDTSGAFTSTPAEDRFVPTPRLTGPMSFSPDGTRIAVTMDVGRDHERGLFRLDLSDGSLTALSHGVTMEGSQRPSWHPLGTSIAFPAQSPDHPGEPQAYLVHPDGTGQRALLPGVGSYHEWVQWAPNGLALALQSNYGSDGVLVVTPDDTVLARLGADQLAEPQAPVWSPDAAWLYTVADSRASSGWQPELFALPLGGGAPRQLTTDSSVFPGTASAVDPGLALRAFGLTSAGQAAAVAEQLPTSSTVVLATSQTTAAVATPLAAQLSAPLLQVLPTALPTETVGFLQRHPAETAYVVGTVSQGVQDQLRALGASSVTVLTGTDPAAAAAVVAARLPSTAVEIAPTGSAVVEQAATAAVAGTRHQPLLLTGRDALPASTRAALRRAHVRSALVVGSTSAISSKVVAQLKALGVTVNRVAASTPAATALALDTAVRPNATLARPVLVPASAPGVAGALLAARRHTVLLPSGTSASDPAVAWLRTNRRAVTTVDLLAAPSVLPPTLETAVESAAR